MTRVRGPALSLLLVALGCTPDAEPTCDADATSACLVDQQGCELVEDAPVCVTCASGTRADATGACATIGGTAMTHSFPEVESGPGEEILGLCRSWTLGNESELWVMDEAGDFVRPE